MEMNLLNKKQDINFMLIEIKSIYLLVELN